MDQPAGQRSAPSDPRRRRRAHRVRTPHPACPGSGPATPARDSIARSGHRRPPSTSFSIVRPIPVCRAKPTRTDMRTRAAWAVAGLRAIRRLSSVYPARLAGLLARRGTVVSVSSGTGRSWCSTPGRGRSGVPGAGSAGHSSSRASPSSPSRWLWIMPSPWLRQDQLTAWASSHCPRPVTSR